MSDRYVLLGLAGPRSGWFNRVSQWATESVVPADFVKTLSADELRARLATGRPYSAALLDAGDRGVDRDLIAAAAAAGCAAIVVLDRRVERDWVSLGAVDTLESEFDRDALVRAVVTHGRPVRLVDGPANAFASNDGAPRWQCPVVAITGVPGSGRSTMAIAAAQGLADQPRHQPLALADLALEADLAMLLDVGDVVPGVQELVDAHRLGRPSTDTVRRLLFPVDSGGHDLLAGLREPWDWPVLRRGSCDAALEGLRHAYRIVVADTDPDISGESETGSTDIEDRNALARAAVAAASVVMIVGQPGLKGHHRHVRLTRRLVRTLAEGVAVMPIVNHAPRAGPSRREIANSFALLAEAERRPMTRPMFVRHHRQLESRLRDGARLPGPIVDAVATAARRGLEAQRKSDRTSREASRVEPGAIGHWSDDEDAA